MFPHDALRRYPLLAALGPDRLGPWLASAYPTAADIGETLFQAGTPGEHVYLVEEGRVRVLRPGKEGREISLGTYGPSDLFGEYALLPRATTRRPTGPAAPPGCCASPSARCATRWPPDRGCATGSRRGCGCTPPWATCVAAPTSASCRPPALELVDHSQPATFPAGHAIQAEGLAPDRLFLIRTGEVIVERTAGRSIHTRPSAAAI